MARSNLMSRSGATSVSSSTPDSTRSRAEKRDLILAAAIKVFATNGYHGSRVSDIAREAGIAYGLVYHYFKNKEEILATIFEDRWSGFLEAVTDIAGSRASTEERLLSLAVLVLGGFRRRPEWVKVLVLEIQRSSRFAEPSQLRAVGRLFDLVEGILREGQERGELRADLDPGVAVYVFMGALDMVITTLVLGVMRIEGGERHEREYYVKVARNVVEIFLHGLAAEECNT